MPAGGGVQPLHRGAGPGRLQQRRHLFLALQDRPAKRQWTLPRPGGLGFGLGTARRRPVVRAAFRLQQRAPVRVADRVHGQQSSAGTEEALDAGLQGRPHVVQQVAGRGVGVVHALPVEVHDVGAGVRERPRHVPVEADHDARHSGQGRAVDVQLAGHDQVHFVPDAGQTQGQVRIAGQDGVAGRRPRRGHRPVVAAGLGRGATADERPRRRRIGGGGLGRRRRLRRRNRRVREPRPPVRHDRFLNRAAHRKQGVRRRASHCRLDAVLGQLHGREGEDPAHALEQVEGVDGFPLGGRRPQQVVLEGPFGRREVGHEGVDAVRVGVDRFGNFGLAVQLLQVSVCGPSQAQAPGLHVGLKQRCAQQLGQRARRGPGLEFHLEEPVARHHVAQGAKGVGNGGREDVRHPAVVVDHAHRTGQPRYRGLRRAGKPGRVGRAPDAVDRVQERSQRRKRPRSARPRQHEQRQHGRRRGQLGEASRSHGRFM